MKHSKNRRFIIVLAVLFFIASLALAVHHEDNPFQSASCFLCKIKSLNSGTPHKIQTDCTMTVAFDSLFPKQGCFEYPNRIFETIGISTSDNHFSSSANKAPPVFL